MHNIKAKSNNFIKIFFLYILLFILFYLEPVPIGGVDFAVLWKIPLVIVLSVYFFVKIVKRKRIPAFVLFGLLLSLKFFFSLSSLEFISSTVSEFTKFSIFFYIFIFMLFHYDETALEKIGKYLAVFVILSFVPFLLNLLKPLGKSIDISKFGEVTGFSLIGLFQNPHAAGITLAFVLLILLFYLLNAQLKKEKIILLSLLSLGIMELFMTMIRTPLVMFAVGGLYLLKSYLRLKHYILLFLILVVTSGYLYSQYDQSPYLQSMVLRIKGENVYDSTGGVGSGRLLFAKTAIENWKSEGFTSIVIGLGLELGKDKMNEAIGMRIFAHNGYIQILQSEGVIGFTLFMLFLYYLLRYILQHKNSPYYPLLIALYLAYNISILFQGGNYFLLYFLFSVYLSLLSKDTSNQKSLLDNKYTESPKNHYDVQSVKVKSLSKT
jgi:hypothetical protein